MEVCWILHEQDFMRLKPALNCNSEENAYRMKLHLQPWAGRSNGLDSAFDNEGSRHGINKKGSFLGEGGPDVLLKLPLSSNIQEQGVSLQPRGVAETSLERQAICTPGDLFLFHFDHILYHFLHCPLTARSQIKKFCLVRWYYNNLQNGFSFCHLLVYNTKDSSLV